jgi:hypothetical protein
MLNSKICPKILNLVQSSLMRSLFIVLLIINNRMRFAALSKIQL